MAEPDFPDHEYLTVHELAALLRLKERKIYDLAASGAVPCSRATGKLLFPARDIRAWIEGAKSGGRTAIQPRPPIILGSHDPLLDWAARQSRCGLASFIDGSLDGLDRFVERAGIATGLHLRDAKTGAWNVPAAADRADGQNAVLIHFATRQRGLVLRDGGPRPDGLAGLKGLRMVPRQRESGSFGLLRDLAKEAGLNLADVVMTQEARTEDAAVEAVRRGEADVTFGLAAVAGAFDLGFVPVIEEEFALLVDRKAWFEPGFQTLMAFCRSDAVHDRAAQYGGYDLSRLGEVLWNA